MRMRKGQKVRYVHTYPPSHTQFKRLPITYTYILSMRGFPIKIRTGRVWIIPGRTGLFAIPNQSYSLSNVIVILGFVTET